MRNEKTKLHLIISLILIIGFLEVCIPSMVGTANVDVVKITIEGTSITAFNEGGGVLWIKNLENDITCHVLTDLNKGGKNEIIIGTGYKPGDKPGYIHIFNSNGTELWEYKTGTGCERVFHRSDIFTVTHILVDDLDNDGKKEILVNSHNVPWYPARLLLFDANGAIKKEYWHPGYIFDVKIADIESDGYKEIIGGGTNNDLGHIPVIFVLNPQIMKGQAPPYCGNFPHASEKYYKKIPLSEVRKEGCSVKEISFDGDRLVASTEDGRFFYYDSNMNSLGAGYSDWYIQQMEKIKEEEEKIKEKEFYTKTYPLILTIVGIIVSIIGGVFLGAFLERKGKMPKRKK